MNFVANFVANFIETAPSVQAYWTVCRMNDRDQEHEQDQEQEAVRLCRVFFKLLCKFMTKFAIKCQESGFAD